MQDPRVVKEKHLRQQVMDFAAHLGWTHRYFTWRSTHSPAGFPDLVLVKPGKIIFVELKSMKGKLSDYQISWLIALACAGQWVYVWNPDCWPEIEEVLRGDKKRINNQAMHDAVGAIYDLSHEQAAQAQLDSCQKQVDELVGEIKEYFGNNIAYWEDRLAQHVHPNDCPDWKMLWRDWGVE